MSRKRVVIIIACFLVAIFWVGVIALWRAPQVRWVSIALKSGSLTHDSQSVAEFVVTNAGAKPVTLGIFVRDLRKHSRFDLNGMSAFSVNAFTNGALRLRGLSPTEPWRICADVYEPAGPFAKGEFAARRLWAFLRGKAAFSGIWSWNSIPATYEVSGPDLPGISLRVVAATPPIQRTEPAESLFWPVDIDPLTNTVLDIWVSPLAQPFARPNGGPVKPVEDW